MRKMFGLVMASALLVSTAIVQPASALGPVSDDFSTNSGLWSYVGSAFRDNAAGRVVLTTPATGEAGIAWMNQAVRSSFTAEFDYWAGGGSGADGLDFLFFKQTGYAPDNGGAIGFTKSGGTPVPGYGIEFDNWYNSPWDPDANHIALVKDTYANHLQWVHDMRTEDQRWHHVKVAVDAAAGTVQVWVDGGQVLNWSGTLDTTYGGMGFSGATGAATNWALIDNFQLEAACTVNNSLTWQSPLSNGSSYDLPAGGTLPIAFTYGSCAGPVVDDGVIVQVVNAADPGGLPVTTWVTGYDIVYDPATAAYSVNFQPALYGLTAGRDLQVQVYMGGALVGTAGVHLVP